jgi:hypothetical protein
MKKKKKNLPNHIRKIIDNVCQSGKFDGSVDISKAGTSRASRIEVDFPICISVFNDTNKPIMIRATPWTHAKNPETIQPKESQKIYIQEGFLKLWDYGTTFSLLVE